MELPQRVLVTGAAGFLGGYISKWFQNQGASVTEVVRSKRDLPLPPPGIVPTNPPRQGLLTRLAVPAEKTWEALLEKDDPQVVVHCAGSSSVPDSMREPGADFESGPTLTFAILDALRTVRSAGRFIFLSSAAVYGNPGVLPISEEQPPNPLSPYGFHKWQSELLCREFFEIYGIPTASLRIFSAYGAGLRRQVIWDVCLKVLQNKPFVLHGTGQESRDFIHASDVAQAVGLVSTRAEMHSESYNVGAGREVSIAELAGCLLQVAGADGRLVSFDGAATPGNPINWCADVARLGALGFRTNVELEDGLRTTVAWCKEAKALL